MQRQTHLSTNQRWCMTRNQKQLVVLREDALETVVGLAVDEVLSQVGEVVAAVAMEAMEAVEATAAVATTEEKAVVSSQPLHSTTGHSFASGSKSSSWLCCTDGSPWPRRYAEGGGRRGGPACSRRIVTSLARPRVPRAGARGVFSSAASACRERGGLAGVDPADAPRKTPKAVKINITSISR